jgi:hypothetical protein
MTLNPQLWECEFHPHTWPKWGCDTLVSLIDALLGPGVNPLKGSPNVKLRKLGPKGTLPASNFRRAGEGRVGSPGIRLGRGTRKSSLNLHPKTDHGRLV